MSLYRDFLLCNFKKRSALDTAAVAPNKEFSRLFAFLSLFSKSMMYDV
jgi:hypothetical protein